MIANRVFKTITLAAAAALISVLAIACGDETDTDAGASLSHDDVRNIVREEIANAPEPGLERSEVERIVREAVADSLTYEDVEAIMRDSMADMAAMTPGDGGLTRADVDAMIQAAMDSMPQPEPTLTRADMEQAIRDAMAGMEEPDPALTRADVEQIARAVIPVMPPPIPPEPRLSAAEVEEIARGVVASIPYRSNPAAYTKFFVDSAIARYEADGLDDTLAYYNSDESLDGQWYVFVVAEDGEVVGHYDPEIRGQNLNGPIGTDATGYVFGPDMLAATEDGKWVSYVFNNPATGELESKHSWVIKRDGLIFGSGWYTDPASYTEYVVDAALDMYQEDGLETVLEAVNKPESLDGQWYVFVVAEDGEVVGHYDPEIRGQNLNGPIGTDATGYVFGPDMLAATKDGKWVSYVFNNPATGELESKHSWVIKRDGLIFGSGWYTDPASYTEYVVDAALDMYQEDGLETVLEAVNKPDSLDGQWYVFVVAEDGEVVGHYDPEIRGQNLNGPIGTDATGYVFGPDMLAATEDGKWVPYVFTDPTSGESRQKHSWVVKRDGLIFGSGWYELYENQT